MTKREIAPLVRAGLKVLVFSGNGDPDWPGCEVHYTADSFEKALKKRENFGAFVVVDEATVLYKSSKYSTHPTIYMLGQMGRHSGYRCYFLTQFPTALQHNVRVNCSDVRVFRLASKKQAQMLVDDWGFSEDIPAKVVRLEKLHFYRKVPMQPPELGVLT